MTNTNYFAAPGLAKSGKLISTETIIELICQHYGQQRADVMGKCRNREFAEPRQLIAYFAVCYLPKRMTLNEIARLYRPIKNHATVIHSLRVVRNLIATDAMYRHNVLMIDRKMREIGFTQIHDSKITAV